MRAKAAQLIDGDAAGREEEKGAPALAATKGEKTTIMRSGWAVRALVCYSQRWARRKPGCIRANHVHLYNFLKKKVHLYKVPTSV